MKFIRLEIKNLASLDRQEGEVIEFEKGPLGGSTLFSIVGPTGSGKSTILDAICLALFNRTPRYPRAKNDRNQSIEIYGAKGKDENARLAPTDSRNILTRGKKEAYSRLTFIANDGTLYRAEWSVRKNRIRYEQAQRALYRLTARPDGAMTEELADYNTLPAIIGLDYDQFLRTVVLAQGSFASFLTAREEERYTLLEKLVGCDTLYGRIAEEIAIRKKAAVASLDEINARLSAYASHDLSDDEFKALQLTITRLQEEADSNTREKETVRKQLEWYEAARNIDSDLLRLSAAVEEAVKALESAGPQAERLHMHDLTVEAVGRYREILIHTRRIAEATASIARLSDEIGEGEKSVNAAESAVTAANEKIASAEKNIAEWAPRINRARIITGELTISRSNLCERQKFAEGTLSAVESAKEALIRNISSIAKHTGDLEAAETAKKALMASIAEETARLEKLLDTAESQLKKAAEKLRGTDVAKLQAAVGSVQSDISHLNEAIANRDRHEKTYATLHEYRRRHEELTARKNAISSQLTGIRPEIELSENTIATLREDITTLRSADLQLQRSRLREGKACPLCGSTHHPYADSGTLTPVVDHLSAELDAKVKKLETLKKQSDLLNNESNHIEGELVQLAKGMAENQRSLSELQGQWDLIASAYPAWPDKAAVLDLLRGDYDRKLETTNAALNAYNHVRSEVDKLQAEKDLIARALLDHKADADAKTVKAENEYNRLNTLLQTEKGLSDSLRKALEEKNAQNRASMAEIEKARAEIASKETRLREETGGADPETLDKALNKAVSDAKEAAARLTDTLIARRSALELTKGKLAQTRQQIESERATLSAADRMLEQAIAVAQSIAGGAIDIDRAAIAEISQWKDDWEALRRDMTQIRQRLAATRATLAEKSAEKEKHAASKPEKEEEELKERLRQLSTYTTEELDRCRLRMQNCQEARRQMGPLADELHAARETAADWTQITEAIGGDGKTLRKIAQTYTLGFLIKHANEEIRRFNRRYELLQVKDSLGIRVIDHDRADDIRDTTSLSGGETFIVSLGLALGLSALSSRGVSLSNLFIDEGFGTLDPDSLATVIDALARLQSSRGKKVGVISHTDTMSERITTQIRIVKNGNSGSSHLEFYP